MRAAGKSAGAKNEFCGPMAKSQRMATMTFAALAAAVAPDFHVDVPRAGSLGWVGVALAIVIVFGLFTAARRIARIAAALRGRA